MRGEIVNEFDELVGKYYCVNDTIYNVTLYGQRYMLNNKQFNSMIAELQLYLIPIWE